MALSSSLHSGTPTPAAPLTSMLDTRITAEIEAASEELAVVYERISEEHSRHGLTVRERGKLRARALAVIRARIVRRLKRRPCLDCGGRFPPECMDFDHRPDEEKFIEISHTTLAQMGPEIAKCDLVCANCHRIRTRRRQLAARARRVDRFAYEDVTIGAIRQTSVSGRINKKNTAVPTVDVARLNADMARLLAEIGPHNLRTP